MRFLYRGLQRTFRAVRQRWILCLVLILLQLGLFISGGYVGLTYQIKIVENIQGILEPLQNANYDSASIQEGNPFSAEILKVYENYNLLQKNILRLLIWIGALFLVVNGILWVGTHQMLSIEKYSWKKILHWWARYLSISILALGPLLALYGVILWKMMAAGVNGDYLITTVVKVLVYILLAVYICLQVLFAFLTTPARKQRWGQAWYSFKRTPYLLLLLAINGGIITGTVALLVWIMNYTNWVLLISASLLIVLAFVLTRLFWIAALQELTHETHSH